MNKLSRGNLFKAIEDVACFENSDKKERRVIVNKGEMVEFRYANDAHFRVNDNKKDLYLYLDEDVFAFSFQHIGKIFSQVSWINKVPMHAIEEYELFDKEYMK